MPDENAQATAGQNGAPAAASSPAVGAPALDQAEIKRQNDERAKQGRLLAETRRQADAAEQKVSQLAKELGDIKDWKTERERLEDEAYLAALPEPELLKVRLQRSEDQIKALQAKRVDSPSAATNVTPDMIEAGKQRLKPEVINAINAEFGLAGDFAIDPFDPDLEDSSVAAFQGSARTMARMLQQAQQRSGTSPDSTQENPNMATPKAKQEPIVFKTQQEFQEAVNKAVSNSFNAGAPLSADAAAGARSGEGPTSEDMKKTLNGFSSKQGPQAVLAKLKKQREDAEVALAGGTRG